MNVEHLLRIWASLKARYNNRSRQNPIWDDTGKRLGNTNPVVGELAWNTPDDVLWLVAEIEDDDYESCAEQWGIDKKGNFAWAYFSHCSCNGYEEYDNTYKQFTIDSWQTPARFNDLLEKLDKIWDDWREAKQP